MLKIISHRSEMTNEAQEENIRTKVSTHLSKILMLFGRLNPEYNPRYLPVTITSILHLVYELEQFEKSHYDFHSILSENIERREKYLDVFTVPELVKADRGTRGLRKALFECTNPLIKKYCEEEKKFLKDGLGPQVSKLIHSSLLIRAEKNCKLLSTLCNAENCIALEELDRWCRKEMENLSK